MIKKSIFFLVIVSLFFVSCTITPDNVDTVASHIQKKYDNIDSYKVTLVTSGKNAERLVKRPDKFKTQIGSRLELCNGNTQIYYDPNIDTASKLMDFDCKGKVDESFNVFDKIKNMLNYENVIEETQIDGKNVVHLILSSKEHGYWSEQFWFDKSNYQIIRHSYESNGREYVTDYVNLMLNIDISDDEFDFEFPDGVDVTIKDNQGDSEAILTEIPPPIN